MTMMILFVGDRAVTNDLNLVKFIKSVGSSNRQL